MSADVGESRPPVGPSDEALFIMLRDGNRSAGEELVRRHYEPLVRYLQRLVHDDHAAEELHQQTWLSALDHAGKFSSDSGSGGFKAWLFRIATNKANDYWRSRGREQSAHQGLRLVVEQEAPQADLNLERDEEAQRLLRAIEQLPENQRQVLLMRYYGQLKFIEIAEALGCPLNTALGRMHKAMQKLKQLMETQSV